MPHVWGSLDADAGPSHPAFSNPNFNASVSVNLTGSGNSTIDVVQPNLCFDVHPSRMLYAYCSGNAIFTYDYTGNKSRDGKFLDYAYLPEPCSDVRFSQDGKCVMNVIVSLSESV